MTKFILLAERRSGTSLMIDCLNNHPKIFCGKRVFGQEFKVKNPDKNNHSGDYFLYRSGSIKRNLLHYLNKKSSINNFLEKHFFKKNDLETIGFRFIYNNVSSYPEVVNWIKKNNIKVIHLVRENLLKTYVSTLTAKLHKMHHPRKGEKIITKSVKLDVSNLLKELERRKNEIELNRKIFSCNPYLEIKYEDFVKNRQDESYKILNFLGSESIMTLDSDLVKINPSRLSDVVSNYSEVKKILIGTNYSSFLDY